MRSGWPHTESLLHLDPDFRTGIDDTDLADAVAATVVPVRELPNGRWDPFDSALRTLQPAWATVLEGLIVSELCVDGRRWANLLGPGDIIYPWTPVRTVLPCDSSWASVGRSAIAIANESFNDALARWPSIAEVKRERLAVQMQQLELRSAINVIPRAERRVMALFWYLAERWGTVTRDGVILRIAITHDLVGKMIGARRSTVSLALGMLGREGLLHRERDGSWRIARDSMEFIGPLRF